MEIRYPTSPDQIPLFDTQDLRDRYLIEDVFVPGEIRLTYTHHDRIVLGGVTPAGGSLTLPTYDALRTEHFFTGREAGIINVGSEAGTIVADGETCEMPAGACLYIGRGARDVVFSGNGRFYLFSATAHAAYPTTRVLPGEGNVLSLGEQVTSNEREIHQLIHLNGVRSCQVVMGVTHLAPGSMWNTMPAHTHDRRTECYLYYGLADDARIVHLVGEPTETRHLMMANEQAVISPSWSVHSGVGTAAYSFVWAMAGENQEFTDMDPCPPVALR
jgi:4-deoxy-L-threo-5-hexosulose-uronate ketol-isomerase